MKLIPPQTSVFGILPNGSRVDRISLANKNGVSVDVITYGATVTSVKVPSKATGPEVRPPTKMARDGCIAHPR